MVTMNFEKIKKNFPIFAQQKGLLSSHFTYLDSAATYQKPQAVIDAIQNYYACSYATVHRSFYYFGEQSTFQYEKTRETVAAFINAASPEEIVFTKGATEGVNFVADAWARQKLQKGDEILLSQVEHHANLLPWQRIAQQARALLKFIPLNRETFTLDYSPDLITEKTKLVSVTYASNVLGNVWVDQQLSQLIARAHQVGARVMIDAAQAVAHQSIDIKKLKPDLLVFSGHKVLGPTGVGVLYINKALHHEVEPYQLGGSMVHSVSFEHAQWAQAPRKFEAGTPPIASVLGLGAALDYFQQSVNFASLAAHETALTLQLFEGLRTIEGIFIAASSDQLKKHSHLLCFTIEGVHPHDIATYLGAQGIAVRAGHHCAQPLVNLLGVDALLRVSFGMYNNSQDVSLFLEALRTTVSFFKNLKK
jgi:cysteine desulfurase / selenocysteine lyase